MLGRMPRLALVTLLLLTACGDGGADSTSTPSPTPQATVDTTDAEPSLPPPTPECVDESITGNPEVTIKENDNAFSPRCVIVLGGQGLKIVNKGASKHNFTVDGSDVDIDTESGDTVRTEAVAGAIEPGTHEFYCKYHRALGMVGEITVSEAG
jgi:plastocyanin